MSWRPAFAAAAVLLPAVLHGQTMRDFGATRQRHGENRLVAQLDFAAGSLRLLPGPAGELYRYQLRYDSERFAPLVRFGGAENEVRLGLQTIGGTGLRVSSRKQLEQLATVTLSPEVTLALDASLGAVDGDLELGGLQLANVALSTGASRTTVRFSRPNRIRCSSASFITRATDIEIIALGNSRCQAVAFAGGVGTATLDLSGTWSDGATLDLSMTAGELILKIPRSLGVRIRAARFLSHFPDAGWARQGDELLSPYFGSATRTLDVVLSTRMGSVSVEWIR